VAYLASLACGLQRLFTFQPPLSLKSLIFTSEAGRDFFIAKGWQAHHRFITTHGPNRGRGFQLASLPRLRLGFSFFTEQKTE
jgi:hypothetical protein